MAVCDNETFFRYIKEGNVEAIKEALKENKNLCNEQHVIEYEEESHAIPPIFYAIWPVPGHPPIEKVKEITELLIGAGADINILLDINGAPTVITPLKCAISRNNFELVKLFLDNGADINMAGQNFPILHYVTECHASTEILELLINKGADLNARDANNKTALMNAVEERQVHLVQALLSKNIDVNLQNFQGNSALTYSVTDRSIIEGENTIPMPFDPVIVELLLEYGADVNLVHPQLGQTPIASMIQNDMDMNIIYSSILARDIVNDKNDAPAVRAAIEASDRQIQIDPELLLSKILKHALKSHVNMELVRGEIIEKFVTEKQKAESKSAEEKDASEYKQKENLISKLPSDMFFVIAKFLSSDDNVFENTLRLFLLREELIRKQNSLSQDDNLFQVFNNLENLLNNKIKSIDGKLLKVCSDVIPCPYYEAAKAAKAAKAAAEEYKVMNNLFNDMNEEEAAVLGADDSENDSEN